MMTTAISLLLAKIAPTSIVFVVFSPNLTPKVTTLVIDEDRYGAALGNATIIGNQLVFSIYANNIRSIYSFPIDRLGSQGEKPKSVSIIGLSSEKVYADNTQAFGPDLFANLSGGDLEVRPYDISVGFPLEHNVTYLYDTSQKASWQTALH